MKKSLVMIPDKAHLEYSCVRVPVETPLGIMEGSTWEVRIDGNVRYQLIDTQGHGPYAALDMDTGDAVWLSFPCCFG